MPEIPSSPESFFSEYVPEQVARLKGTLADHTSVGSVVFEVTGKGTWALKLVHGEVRVSEAPGPDALVRITLAPEDFAPIIVGGADRLGDDTELGQKLMASRVLTIDAERARLLREAPGSVALKLTTAGGPTHRLVVTLGAGEPKLDAPECELECALEDLWAIQGGTRNPFELLMDGKLRLTGKMELAMALAAALG